MCVYAYVNVIKGRFGSLESVMSGLKIKINGTHDGPK